MNRGKLGFGMYKITDEQKLDTALRTALDVGYTHIDTASFYNNEELIGRVIKDYKNITVTTKIWLSDMAEGKIEKAVEDSFRKLGKIDILFIHWPHPDYYINSYKYIANLYKQGMVKKIGVSNFEICHLEELAKHSDVVPYINQIELHPKLSQKRLREYNESKGIITEAWSPIAKAKYIDDALLQTLAEKYNSSPAQIMLAWEIQNNIYPIPKSETPKRIIENYNSQFINISKEDMEKLDAMNSGRRISIHPLDFPYEMYK